MTYLRTSRQSEKSTSGRVARWFPPAAGSTSSARRLWRGYLLLVLALLIFAFACTPISPMGKAEIPPDKRYTTFKVEASPRMGLRPVLVTVRAVLDNEDERTYCPGVRWTVEEAGVSAYEESDCEAFERTEGGASRRVWTRKYVLGSCGSWTFRVALEKPEGVTIRESVTHAIVTGCAE